MQCDDKELDDCRVLVASSKVEGEEGEAKSEELGLIPGGILGWEEGEAKSEEF